MSGAVELFVSIGLSESKAQETARNAAVSNTLSDLIVKVGVRKIYKLYLRRYEGSFVSMAVDGLLPLDTSMLQLNMLGMGDSLLAIDFMGLLCFVPPGKSEGR